MPSDAPTAAPEIGVECYRCGFVLRADERLDRTPRSARYPCHMCLFDPPLPERWSRMYQGADDAE